MGGVVDFSSIACNCGIYFDFNLYLDDLFIIIFFTGFLIRFFNIFNDFCLFPCDCERGTTDNSLLPNGFAISIKKKNKIYYGYIIFFILFNVFYNKNGGFIKKKIICAILILLLFYFYAPCKFNGCDSTCGCSSTRGCGCDSSSSCSCDSTCNTSGWDCICGSSSCLFSI